MMNRMDYHIGAVQTGARGLPGKSAYQLWLDEGNNGTMEDFLHSLKGEQGVPGVPGEKGEKGEKGEPGSINNVRFFISEDGHLHVENID